MTPLHLRQHIIRLLFKGEQKGLQCAQNAGYTCDNGNDYDYDYGDNDIYP